MKNNKKTVLFPHKWFVYQYKSLWKYHSEIEFDEENYKRWTAEAEDMVLKIYYTEKYNSLMRGEKPVYSDVFETCEYFFKQLNMKAVDNLVWILKEHNEFYYDYNNTIINEIAERTDILKRAYNIKNKPLYYLIKLDKTILKEKQKIIEDIEYLKGIKEIRGVDKKELSSEDYFHENAITDSELILLGNVCSPEYIVDTMESIQSDKDLLYSLIWMIDNFFERYNNEIIRELTVFKSKNVLNTINEYIKKEKQETNTEERYFSKVLNLILKHNEIKGVILVKSLYFYKDEKTHQFILSQLDQKSLLDGIKYASEIEDYELAKFLHIYINKNKDWMKK